VHTHSSKAGILGRAAAKAAGAEVVIHSIHGFGFHDSQPAPLQRLLVGLERAVSRWTDAFIAVSRENIRQGVREKIVPPGKVRLIRSGFDTARFLAGSRERGRRLLGIPEGVPVVGTVGPFKPQKAPLDFVEVARRVRGKVPGARFVMVGDGELRPRVEQAVAEGGLSGNFLLPGWSGEVPDLLRAFDVFLLTSRWEGLPRVDTGLLARRVLDLIEGEGKLTPFFKRDRLVREFDQGEMVRAQERLYEELLARRNGS
jgi:glycosyltransferase involved in cell wall biosynthesis